MHFRDLFIPTKNAAPADEVSRNGQLLQQAGYVDKLHAGVYSWLPLGLRVLENVARVIREEHAAIGANEVLMPALQPKSLWEETGRWATMREVMYQFDDGHHHDVGLAATHEEVIVDIVRRSQPTYRDLPYGLYQMQWKFRNEPRAKSGVMRGREFLMKDLYSFHASAEDLQTYYECVHKVYGKIFKRCGLQALITEASGGTFTKRHSHEFQVLSPAGEDNILHCASCGYAQNVELGTSPTCPKCGAAASIEKSIEVGNTFNFGDYYGTAMRCTYTDAQGKRQPMHVASYGIGVSRLVGAVAEVHADDRGLVWPASIAPFRAHVLIAGKADDALQKQASAFCAEHSAHVLFDDREVSPGYKLKDADLLGVPLRFVFSARNNGRVECTERATGTTTILTEAEAHARLTAL